jgi:hypothetical protein
MIDNIRLTTCEIGYLKISVDGSDQSEMCMKEITIYTDLDQDTLDAGIEAYLGQEGLDVDVDRLCLFITITAMRVGVFCVCVPKEFGDQIFKQN